MNYEGIESFLAVAETGSLSKAAKKLFVSQSAISQRVKALEAELGTELIIRKKGVRTIGLTPKGSDFMMVAEKWRLLWIETGKIIEDTDRLTLSIACVDSISSCVLHDLFKKLSSMNPPLYLMLQTHQAHETYTLVEDRKVDIGFALREVRTNNIITTPSYSEKMCFISSTNGTAYPNPVDPALLYTDKEIFLPWNPQFSEWHTRWFGYTLRPHVYTDIISTMKHFFSDGDYWAIVPNSAIHTLKKDVNIQVAEIINGPQDHICYMVEHKFPNTRSKTSIEVFKRNYAEYIESTPWLNVL